MTAEAFTVPTERLYPYQWNWDSAICALGWQSFDEARAWKEIRMLLKGAVVERHAAPYRFPSG
ncbi:MAG: hypothetical protein Ct9H90mP9_2200 [Pseudomonadota bacterium]|nr:MAG: hypothetical protein Ct9H90mP9_2200 [Pseudomonadota bacterium]